MDQMSQNQTLEINPSHSLLVKLNQLRKVDPDRASVASKAILDNALMANGMPQDPNKSAQRNLGMLDDYMQLKVNSLQKSIQ